MNDQDKVPPSGTPRHSGVPSGSESTPEAHASAAGKAGPSKDAGEDWNRLLSDRPGAPHAPPEGDGLHSPGPRDEDRPSEDWDSSQLPSREPAFNLPSSLVWILALLVLIHAVRTYLLPVEIDDELIFNFAFLPARYDHPLAEQGLAWIWTPVTYSFLHGSWEHLIFNAFWMLAFGAPVVRRIGTLRLVIFWCLSAIAAVGLHLALHWGDMTVVIGASGVVAGLMGAAARFVFSPSGRISRQFAHRNPRLSIAAALSNRSVLFFSGVWFATNLLIGLGLFTLAGDAGIAWEAHIGGFLFGFLFFGLIDPRSGQDERVQQG